MDIEIKTKLIGRDMSGSVKEEILKTELTDQFYIDNPIGNNLPYEIELYLKETNQKGYEHKDFNPEVDSLRGKEVNATALYICDRAFSINSAQLLPYGNFSNYIHEKTTFEAINMARGDTLQITWKIYLK